MLAGLGLDAFVGGDDQQHKVDTPNAGQHVADEALMARDIHESQAKVLA